MSGPPTAFGSPAPTQSKIRLRFPPELPISARVDDIQRAISAHQVVIVAGATGSGKTTQLPKIALQVGRGSERLIGVTQPRRLAATSVAARVASEVGCALGNEVGYQIRFEDRTTSNTRVKFMTDGILLAEIQGDRRLCRYDTLIIDEAHERSLTIDFLLGWVKRILAERPELKVIISSATIETERFSKFFDGAPVIQVEGRTFPVDVLYEPPDPELELAQAAADAVETVISLDPSGDILVFLPGEREIRDTEQLLRGRKLRQTTIQPLYARLTAAEQSRVFASIPDRRVILATNVAETSLTLPGIVYVVDTGVARLSRYEPRTGTTRLQIEPISQASADQRKGRCGRVRDGICVRLYDESDFSSRPAFTDPEIKRTGLAAVILRMKSLGLGDVEDFPFLDAPQSRSITEGYHVLQELGALDADRQLTPLGRQLGRFPLDPRLARMIMAGADNGCLPDILIVTAALELQDPRERPRGLEQKAEQLHRRFRDERSDFAGLLRLWAFVSEARAKGTSHLKRVCKDNLLSFARVREWFEVHRQLQEVVRELRLARRSRGEMNTGDALHQALLTGLLSRIGQYHAESRVYLGARQTRFLIHPSSALSRKPPAWVMAYELVQTTQLFARTTAKIEPVWLNEVAGHLLKRRYGEPFWSEKAARAKIKEHATLFGLPVLRDRSVDYSSVAPGRARLIFLEHALVRGEYHSRGSFQTKNERLLAEVARLRDKARQSALLADDEALLSFFDKRVPQSVFDGVTFEAWREGAEAQDGELLSLSISDVLASDRQLDPEQYPDVITLRGSELQLCYRFDPSAEDDGVTVIVPLTLLLQLEPGDLDGTIPAWQRDKILALLEGLPKHLRRQLVPLAPLADRVSQAIVPFQGPFVSSLAQAIEELVHVSVPPSAFRVDTVPGYLQFTCRLVDERGKLIAQHRDLSALMVQYGARAREAFERTADDAVWNRTGITPLGARHRARKSAGITRWDFGDLPQYVTRQVSGTAVRLYPALALRDGSVALTLMQSERAALDATRGGLRRLLVLATQRELASLAKRVPPPFPHIPGVPPSRTAREAFREQVLSRVVDGAFALRDSASYPRDQPAFEALLAAGTPRLQLVFDRLSRAIASASAELEQTLRALANAEKQPSGTRAVRDIRDQLTHLFCAELLSQVELVYLEQYPRYLRAAQIRLARAIVDPRKDAEKLSPVAPLWTKFLKLYPQLEDQSAGQSLRWAFEELRVAVFAPELKPAFSVSVQSLARELEALS